MRFSVNSVQYEGSEWPQSAMIRSRERNDACVIGNRLQNVCDTDGEVVHAAYCRRNFVQQLVVAKGRDKSRTMYDVDSWESCIIFESSCQKSSLIPAGIVFKC